MHRRVTVVNKHQPQINRIHNKHLVLITINNKSLIHWIQSKVLTPTANPKNRMNEAETMELFWPAIHQSLCKLFKKPKKKRFDLICLLCLLSQLTQFTHSPLIQHRFSTNQFQHSLLHFILHFSSSIFISFKKQKTNSYDSMNREYFHFLFRFNFPVVVSGFFCLFGFCV